MKSPLVRMQTFRDLLAGRVPIALLAALFVAAPFHVAFAQTAPSLGTAQSFAVLGGSTVTNIGPTIVTGDLGLSPGSAVTGFPPGTVVGGTTHITDAVASGAQSDTTTAYNSLAGQACGATISADLGGTTLAPGVYCANTSAQLTGALTLDAGGNPNAVWVFQIGTTLTTASGSSMLLINGAQNCNVFWQVGSSATLGTGTAFVGNILALQSITLNTGATMSGRALARNGAVTLDSNSVAVSACAVAAVNPTLGKAFSPATINAGGSSTLTITLSNAGNTAAGGAGLTDTLPAGMVTSGSASTTCGGTASSTSSSVTLTGGSIPANGSCTLTVNVTAPNGGSLINSLAAGALHTNNGNNSVPAVATLTVIPAVAIAPTLGKAFSPATINAGGISLLTITLSNAGGTAANLTSPLTDTLPAGVVTSGSASTTCVSGVASATTSTVTLTGGTIPANGSCTLSVNVTAPTGGSFINSLAAGALQTNNGPNAAPAVATLTVIPAVGVAPTLGKAFSPASIAPGGISLLTITLSNAGASADTLTAPLTDTLPAGVVTSGSASTTCVSGVASATTSTVTLTGGTIPAKGSCTLTVNVTAPNGGSFINTLAAGALQTNNGNNAGPAIATLTVSSPSPITLGKTFTPATVGAGTTSTLTITLSNSGATPATLTAPLTDTLPAGLVVNGSPSNTCGGSTSATTSTVTLTGGSIPAQGSCTVTVPVVAAVAGSYFNTLAAGALQTNKGNNAGPAIATLTVNAPASGPPTISKSFSPVKIPAGGISLLTITLTNPNSTPAKLTAPLIDNLPNGVVVSGSASTTCGGTLSTVASMTLIGYSLTPGGSSGGGGGGSPPPPPPPPPGSSVTLTGGTIPANGSCTITVNVTSNEQCSAANINTIPAGALKTDKGNNASKAVATLTVTPVKIIVPTLTKSFSPTSIPAGGTSTLTITLTNPNSSVAKITAPLIDNLPTGVVVAGSASTTCGGTLSTAASMTLVPYSLTPGGSNGGGGGGSPPPPPPPPGSSVTLTGGTIPANGSCTVTVKVTANAQCSATNTNTIPAGALKTDKGNNATPAVAVLTVSIVKTIAPTLTKSFSPAAIKPGGVSTLTITLSNPNSSAASMTAALTDNLPSGVLVAASPNASTTCGGTLTAKTGGTAVTLTGGSIPANSSCKVTVNITANYNGVCVNTIPVGALHTNQGNNATAAVATLTVKP